MREQFYSLLHIPNVRAVGIGYKWQNGKPTRRTAVVVFVEKKLPTQSLSAHETVPLEVAGMETDVEEIGELRLLAAPRQQKMRPAMPGVSIGHRSVTAGTLGAIVFDRSTGEPLILSNNHVLANRTTGKDGRARIGDPILQPGAYDGGTAPQDVIGTLYRFVPLNLDIEESTCPIASLAALYINRFIKLYRPYYVMRFYRRVQSRNTVDCAVAKPVRPSDVTPEILEIGPIRGVLQPEVGMTVRKSGRTTGVTEGTVRAVSATARIDMGDNVTALFEDQFITTPMSKGGDSGSLVLDTKNNAVGLVFAGSELATVCNNIANVLDALNVRF
ncbi:MAG: hypothetical protein ACPLPR_01990 [Bacillota bacterium]